MAPKIFETISFAASKSSSLISSRSPASSPIIMSESDAAITGGNATMISPSTSPVTLIFVRTIGGTILDIMLSSCSSCNESAGASPTRASIVPMVSSSKSLIKLLIHQILIIF